jgi:hypothetical protein
LRPSQCLSLFCVITSQKKCHRKILFWQRYGCSSDRVMADSEHTNFICGMIGICYLLQRFTPIAWTEFPSCHTFHLSFHFLSVPLLCRCLPILFLLCYMFLPSPLRSTVVNVLLMHCVSCYLFCRQWHRTHCRLNPRNRLKNPLTFASYTPS